MYADVLVGTPVPIVLQVTDYACRHETDIEFGFGGGRSMDVAKVISVLAAGGHLLSGIYGFKKMKETL